MLSRVADSIYWMNRYIERAENYARFINVNFTLALDMPMGKEEQWEPLLEITEDILYFRKKYDTVDKEKVIDFLAFDTDNPNSIYSCIAHARENARTVRENISTEMWEQVNSLYLLMREPKFGSGIMTREPMLFFREVISGIQSFRGITASTISRSDAWHFGRLGLFLERADKTSRLVDVKYHILLPSAEDVGSTLDLLQWAALLKSVSAYSVCRRKYGYISPNHVIELLILDRRFPRSIYFCIKEAFLSMREVSGNSDGNSYNIAEKLMGSMHTQLEYTDIQGVIKDGVHEYLDRIQVDIMNISDAIFASFFAHSNIDK